MRKKFILTIAAIAICSGTFIAGRIGLSAAPNKTKNEDLFRQVELFSGALAIIKEEYVEETNAKDLIYGALKGMLASLDAHSQFMDPDTYNELKADTEGKFGGLGIEITLKDGLLTVISPLEDTPAWKAGIKANDRIVKINNELTRDITLTDAAKKLRGPPGEPVTLTIFREAQKKILEFTITRDIIKVKDIKDARILEDGIAYIRLIEFREDTSRDLDAALENLLKQGANGIILDLRNNPGGLLDAACSVAEKFVENGKLIVYTKGRKASQELKYAAHSKKPIIDLPMVVLINDGSASGSEIVAGCLQDYKRAIITGKKSFGKGSVQTLIPLGDGSALRLTTSKYFTPLGREIHGKGVMPDIVAEESELRVAEDAPEDAKKVEEVFEKVEKKSQAQLKEEAVFDYKSDNQLMRALDILKALKIYKK